VRFRLGQARQRAPRPYALTLPKHHPSAQALADFLIGDCSPGTAQLLAGHLDMCAQCRSRVQQMGATSAPFSTLPEGPASELAPGVEAAPLSGASGLGEVVYVIRAAAGAAAPLDSALAAAEVLVLSGGFCLGDETFVTGDFVDLSTRAESTFTADVNSGLRALVTAPMPDLPDHSA